MENNSKLLGDHPVPVTDYTFDQLGLSEPVLKAVEQIGFVHPTPIQRAVIPGAIQGTDIIGLAQTGSGKTAAFVLPMVEKLNHGRGVQGLILCPTREIALQTKAFLDLLGKDHQLKTVCLIGGVSMGPQIKDLKNNPDIVVATPGRLLDHLEKNLLHLNNVCELVLDEADHMLDMGFLPQVESILRLLPKKRHTMMFSATMPPPIERLAARFLAKPVRIDILPQGKAAQGLSHRLYLVAPDKRKDCLLALLNQELGSTLVFARRKMDAEWLSRELSNEGHPVVRIHSDLSQKERTESLQDFRQGSHRILVATDIASRGIDIPGIEHVVNFDVPETVEDYIHRAGRTARAKAIGLVSSIGTWQDLPMIKSVEEEIGQKIPRCTVPGVTPFVEIVKDGAGGSRTRSGLRRRR